jgi:predicted RNase H-like HicB family nuclease
MTTGCVSQGKTKQEAIENIREAIRAYVTALKEDHIEVHPDTLDALLVAV